MNQQDREGEFDRDALAEFLRDYADTAQRYRITPTMLGDWLKRHPIDSPSLRAAFELMAHLPSDVPEEFAAHLRLLALNIETGRDEWRFIR